MLNKVTLIGNLGADPEVRYMSSGGAVVNIRIATSSRWKDKQTGERRQATEWHRVVFFNRLAEVAGEYLKKGRQVYIEGRLQTRKWQGPDGQDRYTTEIVVSDIQMLGNRSGGTESFAQDTSVSTPSSPPPAPTDSQNTASTNPSSTSYEDFDDDIPF